MPNEKQLLQFSPLKRPSVSATVSMPDKWKALDNTLPSDITILTVPNVLKRHEEPWKDILERGQDLDKILDNLSPINSSSGGCSHYSLERLFRQFIMLLIVQRANHFSIILKVIKKSSKLIY